MCLNLILRYLILRYLVLRYTAGCAAIGMLGLCCPTPDGAMLACCDALLGGEKRMQEEWRSLIYVDHAGVYVGVCVCMHYQ